MVPMVIQFSFGQILRESALHSYINVLIYDAHAAASCIWFLVSRNVGLPSWL